MFKINGVIWQIYLVDPYHPMLLKPDKTFSVGACDRETQGIYINDMLDDWFLKRVLCHEIVHGIFVHLGYNDYAQDEQLVQALGNAIYQGFNIKVESEDE